MCGIVGLFFKRGAVTPTFGPLLAHTSMWFVRRRGIAVAIVASGNYLAGAVWPPIVQHFIESAGWRTTYLGIGVFCLATMVPLAPGPNAIEVIARDLVANESRATISVVVDREGLKGRVQALPKREDLVQIQLNEQLIVELYSK